MAKSKELVRILRIRELLVDAFSPDELYRFCRAHRDFRPVLSRLRRVRDYDEMLNEVLIYCEEENLLQDLQSGIEVLKPAVFRSWKQRHFLRKHRALPPSDFTLVIALLFLCLVFLVLGSATKDEERASEISLPDRARLFTVVYKGPDGASVRRSPRVEADELDRLFLGAELEATGKRQVDDEGRVWWEVHRPGGWGWVAEFDVKTKIRLLVPKIAVGDKLDVVYGGEVNLRHVTTCQPLHKVRHGELLTVVDGPKAECDPNSDPLLQSEKRQWWQAVTSDGKKGWIAEFSADSKNLLIAPRWYAHPSPATDSLRVLPLGSSMSAEQAIREYYAIIDLEQYAEAWKMSQFYTEPLDPPVYESFVRGWQQSGPAMIQGDVETNDIASDVAIKIRLYYPKTVETYTLCYTLERDYERGDSHFGYWIIIDGDFCD